MTWWNPIDWIAELGRGIGVGLLGCLRPGG